MIEGKFDCEETYLYEEFEKKINYLNFPEIEGLISKERDLIRKKYVEFIDKIEIISQNNEFFTTDFYSLFETCQRQNIEIEKLKKINSEKNNIIRTLTEKIASFENLDENQEGNEKPVLNNMSKNQEILKQFQEKISDFMNFSNNTFNELIGKIKLEFESYLKHQKVDYQNKLKRFNSKIQSLHNHINFLKERIPNKIDYSVNQSESFTILRNNDHQSIEVPISMMNSSNTFVDSEISKTKKTPSNVKATCKRLDFSSFNEDYPEPTYNKYQIKIDRELIELSKNLKIKVSRLQRLNGRIVVRVGGGYFVVKDYTKDISESLNKKSISITRIEGDQRINGTKRTNYVKSPLAKHLYKTNNQCNLSNDNISNISDSSMIRLRSSKINKSFIYDK